jgi:hypothetical protein
MVLLSAWCGLRYGEVRAGRLTQPERPTVNHRDDKPRRHLAKERLQPRDEGSKNDRNRQEVAPHFTLVGKPYNERIDKPTREGDSHE